jgi:iron complex transport system substrate-binding protein
MPSPVFPRATIAQGRHRRAAFVRDVLQRAFAGASAAIPAHARGRAVSPPGASRDPAAPGPSRLAASRPCRPRLGRSLAGTAVLVAVLAGAAAPTFADALLDARGTPVGLVDPARVVSIGGTVTEILYDLGLEDRVVAVDTTSTEPPRALTEKPNVGYMRALSAEGVLSMAPTLILATESAGPPEVIDLLAQSSVPLVLVNDDTTPEAVADRIRFVAAVMGAEGRGAALSAEVEGAFAALAEARAAVTKPARVLFVLTLRDGLPMTAGTDTAADSIIRLAGGVNAGAGFEGYKPMTEEAVVASAPDVVLMMRSAAHAAGTDVLALPAFRGTPAAANDRFVSMDGQSLLGFGPRTPAVARQLAAELHPGQVTAAPGAP